MKKIVIGAAGLLAASTVAFAAPDQATNITSEQVQQVLKAGAKATDHTIRVVDMGGYQLSVAVVHRGPTRPAGARPAGAGAQPQAAAEPCGLTSAPAGAKLGPAGMILHDDTAETYIIISGSGTLVTGGQILNGRRSAPDSDVTKILNGPSCSGQAVGNFKSQVMKVGDISVIPAGVPHGWTGITTEVTYLSMRPDPKEVLPKGYVYPGLK